MRCSSALDDLLPVFFDRARKGDMVCETGGESAPLGAPSCECRFWKTPRNSRKFPPCAISCLEVSPQAERRCSGLRLGWSDRRISEVSALTCSGRSDRAPPVRSAARRVADHTKKSVHDFRFRQKFCLSRTL